MSIRWLSACLVGAAGLYAGFLYAKLRTPSTTSFTATVQPLRLTANGRDTATVVIAGIDSMPPSITPSCEKCLRLSTPLWADGNWRVTLHAGVLPGDVSLQIRSAGAIGIRHLQLELQQTDRNRDGTPDFIRLNDQADVSAFRRAFAHLAEAQYFRDTPDAEITDCSALIRYAFREALRGHSSESTPGVAKYQYPYTPLGANLFRVRAGVFTPADLTNSAFAEFADARTLARFNSHLVSRDLEAAQPGDLLFFRQTNDHVSFHSMIFVGRGIRDDGESYLVYHTGPTGKDPGEMKRLTSAELLHFPRAEWRPLRTNPSFLGVYQWNILPGGNTDVSPR